ncbi:neuroendocrine convertase 1 [Trichonephila clavipes]|nr:neuroendocrine convertase 1 [Trichonephila clavipes]
MILTPAITLRRSSLVANVTDSWPASHEFEPRATEDPPYRRAMHVKSVESSNVLLLVWSGNHYRGAISGVVLITWPWFKIPRSMAKSPRVAEQCDVFKDGSYYLFRQLAGNTAFTRNTEGLLKDIETHSSVKWVALQTPLTRVKRSVFGELRLIDIYRTTFKAREKKNAREKVLEKFRNTSLINFNDPLFGEQWYLDLENNASSSIRCLSQGTGKTKVHVRSSFVSLSKVCITIFAIYFYFFLPICHRDSECEYFSETDEYDSNSDTDVSICDEEMEQK